MSKDSSAIVDTTIQHRRSTRAYRHDPVPNKLVRHILEVASRAPSGCNTQPWRVHVLTGAARQNIVDTVCHAFESEPDQHVSEYQHTPEEFFEPFLSRRRKMGFKLYELADIPKGDKERMRMQQRRNYTFFDAPVGLLFTVNRDLPIASFIGFGAFMQNIMVCAESHGLGTCFQTAWCDYHRIIAPQLNFAKEDLLIGGMALGYPDKDAPINQLRTERVPVSEFAVFHA
ncbi:MAG: nitroreductase [Oxalobacter sp.]|nr:MAG: nitroreductase [Oxalobacter sp.]